MKKLTAVTLAIIITLAVGMAYASNFTEQDEVLIIFSANVNKVIVENNLLSKVNYIFTSETFNIEKTTVLIDNKTQSVMMASTNYCSWWIFDSYSDFSNFLSMFNSIYSETE